MTVSQKVVVSKKELVSPKNCFLSKNKYYQACLVLLYNINVVEMKECNHVKCNFFSIFLEVHFKTVRSWSHRLMSPDSDTLSWPIRDQCWQSLTNEVSSDSCDTLEPACWAWDEWGSCDFDRPVSLSLSLTVSPVHCDECLHNISSSLTTQWPVIPPAPETLRSWSCSPTSASSASRCTARAASGDWSPRRTRSDPVNNSHGNKIQ